jgi:hypothetical protein
MLESIQIFFVWKVKVNETPKINLEWKVDLLDFDIVGC